LVAGRPFRMLFPPAAAGSLTDTVTTRRTQHPPTPHSPALLPFRSHTPLSFYHRDWKQSPPIDLHLLDGPPGAPPLLHTSPPILPPSFPPFPHFHFLPLCSPPSEVGRCALFAPGSSPALSIQSQPLSVFCLFLPVPLPPVRGVPACLGCAPVPRSLRRQQPQRTISARNSRRAQAPQRGGGAAGSVDSLLQIK
jgi:hypothetical protein